MAIEEGIFYPAVLQTKKTEEMIPEAIEEHHVVKLVLAEIPRVDPEDERFEAKMTVLEELIEHHVEEEEKEMFKTAEKLGDDRLRALGEQMRMLSVPGFRHRPPADRPQCVAKRRAAPNRSGGGPLRSTGTSSGAIVAFLPKENFPGTLHG